MSTKDARKLGFDIATVPDGIHDGKARISLVFQPNGKGNGLGFQWLADKGLASAALNAAFDDPNTLNEPDPDQIEGNQALLWDKTIADETYTKGTKKSLADVLISNLADWLQDLPRALARVGTLTHIAAEERDPSPPPQIEMCTINLPDGREFQIPCNILRDGLPKTVTNEVLLTPEVKDYADLFGSLLSADYSGMVAGSRVSDAWDEATASEVWAALFTRQELEDLARALLFPGNTTERAYESAKNSADANRWKTLSDRLAASDFTRGTLRSDHASSLAGAFSEFSSAELLASALSADAYSKGTRDGRYGGGLTAGDLVGTIHGRLLNTVMTTFPQVVDPLDSQIEAANNTDLSEARRAATVRSLLWENQTTLRSLGLREDAVDRSQKIGALRPGFGELILNQDAEALAYSEALVGRETETWTNAFTNESSNSDKSVPGFAPGPETLSAVQEQITEALGTLGGFGFDADKSALPSTAAPGPRNMGELLAAAALARRTSEGVIEEDLSQDDAADKALRKFYELYAHPVLAEKLGLVQDYEVEIEDLTTHTNGDAGYLRLGVRTAKRDVFSWTATAIDPNAPGTLAFRPAGREEWFANGAPDPRSGLVNLGEKLGNMQRFTLQTVDEEQITRSVTLAAKSSAEQARRAETPEEVDDHLPQLRTYGIALMDRGRLEEEASRLGSAIAAETVVETQTPLVFAETLTIGMRVDIGIVQDSEFVWFDAGERDIAYGLVRGTDISVNLDTATPERDALRERTTAYFTPLNRFLDDPVATSPDGKSAVVGGRPDVVVQETLLTWSGRALSLPRRSRRDEFSLDPFFAPMQDIADGPLPIELDYGEATVDPQEPIKDGIATGVPPLWEQMGYVLGARPVYLNRGGPALREARVHYEDASAPLALGDGYLTDGRPAPLIFGRNEPIAAPQLLLPATANEPLFSAEDIAKWPGNSVDTLILRDAGYDEVADVERYILPPRIDVTTAEVTGVLADAEVDSFQDGAITRPKGMFSGRSVRQVDWSGGFPSAIGGGIAVDPPRPVQFSDNDPDDLANDPLSTASETSVLEQVTRGGVFMQGEETPVEFPYYPDPLAVFLCVMPIRDDRALLSEPARIRVLEEGARWPDLLPCLIQLARPGSSNRANLVVENEDAGVALFLLDTDRGPLGRTVPTLRVEVAEGRSCRLCTWFAPEDESFIKGHNLIRLAAASAMAGADRFKSGDAALRASGLVDLLQSAPLRSLTAMEHLTLTNATQRPVAAPTLLPLDAPDLRTVRWDLSEAVAAAMNPPAPEAGAPEQPALQPKQATIAVIDAALSAQGGTTLPTDPSKALNPNATTLMFGGDVAVHRPSTAELRVEAKWEEWTDDITRPAKRQETEFLRPFAPTQGDGWTILEGTQTPVDNLPDEPNAPINLLRDDAGVPRCLIYDFVDTRARELTVRIAAVSRHAPVFPTTPDPSAFVTPGPEVAIKVPATARPAEPSLAEPMLPVFSEERMTIVSGGLFNPNRTGVVLTRATKLRFFLNRPWYDAGQGQRLAVLLWDGAVLDPDTPSKVDQVETKPSDIPARMRSFVSLHGRDPKFASTSLPDFITGADFIGVPQTDRLAHLTLPDVADPSGDTEKVSAVLFEAKLEAVRDVWIVDVPMAARRSYMPFVRLSLAACQPNSRPGLELSRPIEAFGRIPPAREARLSVEWENNAPSDDLAIMVDGGSYVQRQPGEILQEVKAMADAPWLEVLFVERVAGAEGSGGWVPKPNDMGEDQAAFKQPAPIQAGSAGASVSDKLWDFALKMPSDWADLEGAGDRAVLIREYERVAADADGPAPDLDEASVQALKIVEAFHTSPDGLSSIVRGKTTFAAKFTMQELFGQEPSAPNSQK